MEMLFTIMAGTFVGWLAAMKKDDYEKIVSICFAGGAATALGLVWTILMDRTVGTSASPEWIIVGVVSGVIGLILWRVVNFAIAKAIAIWEAEHADHPHGHETASAHAAENARRVSH